MDSQNFQLSASPNKLFKTQLKVITLRQLMTKKCQLYIICKTSPTTEIARNFINAISLQLKFFKRHHFQKPSVYSSNFSKDIAFKRHQFIVQILQKLSLSKAISSEGISLQSNSFSLLGCKSHWLLFNNLPSC